MVLGKIGITVAEVRLGGIFRDEAECDPVSSFPRNRVTVLLPSGDVIQVIDIL